MGFPSLSTFDRRIADSLVSRMCVNIWQELPIVKLAKILCSLQHYGAIDYGRQLILLSLSSSRVFWTFSSIYARGVQVQKRQLRFNTHKQGRIPLPRSPCFFRILFCVLHGSFHFCISATPALASFLKIFLVSFTAVLKNNDTPDANWKDMRVFE